MSRASSCGWGYRGWAPAYGGPAGPEGSAQEVGRVRHCNGWEIAAIIAGFIIFWPIGLALLVLKAVRGGFWPRVWAGSKPWAKGAWQTNDLRRDSGNKAFEEYKASELKRLEEERQRLAEEQRSFEAFLEQLKRAKDQEEFDRFMASRRDSEPKPESGQPSA